MYPQLLSYQSEVDLIDIIKSELKESYALDIATAFYSRGIINLIQDPFNNFLSQSPDHHIRMLTSVMNNFNNPDDLRHLKSSIPNLELKVFYPPIKNVQDYSLNPPPFHVKCYMFSKENQNHSFVIGSSNLTGGGFGRNFEWNYYSNNEVNQTYDGKHSPFNQALSEFEHYWRDLSITLNEEFLKIYEDRWLQRKSIQDKLKELALANEIHNKFVPRPAQVEALEILEDKRSKGVNKTTVIAATGLGKTILAAFDFFNSQSRNILFVAHREIILNKALESFRKVMNDPTFGYVWSGSNNHISNANRNSCFAMVQTLSRNLQKYSKDYFDYMVIDEFHHAEAKSYKKIVEYFKPKFLLGLTATPERMDGRDVLKICDYDVSYEIRLFDAIEYEWLVPFQYFAIYDASDYSKIKWTFRGYSEEDLDKILIQDTRAKLIIKNFYKYLPSNGKVKALAFCSSVLHAKYMCERFNENSISAVFLTGESLDEVRGKSIKELEDENSDLKVICSVDVFGEGVDIPNVTHVLMLRPTQSFTVFLQQIGRGMRKADNKEYLVVLDFVGNFRNNYVAPLALKGCNKLPEDPRDVSEISKKKPPIGCYINTDIEVQRIWDEEIKRVISSFSRPELLKELYHQMRSNLGNRSPSLMDFFANPSILDPMKFIKQFGSWLEAKNHMDDLEESEKKYVDTIGNDLLRHVEKELSPTRSYKMVVLKCLLELGGHEWSVEKIATAFHRYYLLNEIYLYDWDDIARQDSPAEYPIKKTIQHLIKMPLSKLAGGGREYFELDIQRKIFGIKIKYRQYWDEPYFRELLKDRIEYALARYYYRKYEDEKPSIKKPEWDSDKQIFKHYITKSTFKDGFAISKYAELWVGAPEKGQTKFVQIDYGEGASVVALKKLNNSVGHVQIRYTRESKPLKEWINKTFVKSKKEIAGENFELIKISDGKFRIIPHPK